jgi:hypothetical protein
MRGIAWKDALRGSMWTFAGATVFPKLAHRLRWPTRLGPRGLLLYIALNTLLGLAARSWVAPFFRRLGERRAQAKKELRQQLGREPRDEELGAHLAAR